MPSALTQKLYLGGVPTGLTFELTSIRPTAPNDGYKWDGGFTRRGNPGVVTIGQTVHDNWPMPFQVSMKVWDGLIGCAHFEPHNGLWSHGEGAKVAIDFRLHGTTAFADKSIDVDEAGTIVVSTTDWGGPSRPDFVNITYSWKRSGADPVNIALGIPANLAGMPDDLYFVFAVNPETTEVGVVTTTDKDVLRNVVDQALNGIFWAHGKLFGWAIGKLTPF